MSETYTHTRIRKEYLDKLQALAVANKRSAMRQLEVLVDTVSRNITERIEPRSAEGSAVQHISDGRTPPLCSCGLWVKDCPSQPPASDTERLTFLVECAKKGDATEPVVGQILTLIDQAYERGRRAEWELHHGGKHE